METEKSENSSQETKESKTYTAEQFSGLLADKQAEVKKRQDAEKQIAELQGKLSGLTSRTSRANEEISEDNKPLTIAQFRQLMAEQNKANEENAFLVRQAESEKTAIAELSAQACGEGLDFASVIALGEKNLTEGDKLAIRQAENPAKEKYRRCILLTPELAQRQETLQNSRLLETIKLTGRVPASGADGDVKASVSDLDKMSEDELDRLAESIS